MPSDRAFIVNLPLNLTLSRHENWHRIGSLRKHQIVQTFNNATKTDLLLIELDIIWSWFINIINLGLTFILKKSVIDSIKP